MSKQDYGTPWELIHAVKRQFGHLAVDLAARADNAKADFFITPETDSLSVDWSDLDINEREFAWLNPPFAHIAPWAQKCATSGIPIIMLVPASVGSNWFAEWVQGIAGVFALNPRITFEGCTDPYPKDCMLCVYGGDVERGFSVWKWK